MKPIIQSQYLASLEMLKRAIEACPADLWDDQTDKNRFWHVAFHALFYTHFYVQPTEADFGPWEKHRQISSLEDSVATAVAYTKAETLEYLAFCQQEVVKQTASVDLEAESGFYWLPFNKLELQFYSIRHTQLHVGELCERLWARDGIEIGWVGMKPEP